MLFHPDFNDPFTVHTNASKVGYGAMLAQYHEGQLRPVRYASRSFTPTESRWPTENFHHFLMGRKFKVITDHANLKFLSNKAPQNSKLACWCLSLEEFDFTIEHHAGKNNVIPDTLNRNPLPIPSVDVNVFFIPPYDTIDHSISHMLIPSVMIVSPVSLLHAPQFLLFLTLLLLKFLIPASHQLIL